MQVKDTRISGILTHSDRYHKVERAFQDAKGTAVIEQYQIRSWQSWHHHMSLVMMSMLFMLETRLKQKENHPFLSCPDIATLLAIFLTTQQVNNEASVTKWK